MNLLYAIYNFMNYGVRSLFARTQSLKSSFSLFFFLFKTSEIFATSLDINVSQHILSICVGEINPFGFRNFLRFSRFSRNYEKWS